MFPFKFFCNKKNARENYMTSDEAVNDDKNYNRNVHSDWQTAVVCYLTFYACVFSISPHDSLSRGSTANRHESRKITSSVNVTYNCPWLVIFYKPVTVNLIRWTGRLLIDGAVELSLSKTWSWRVCGPRKVIFSETTARTGKFKHCFQLAPVVQSLDSPIHRIKTLNLIAQGHPTRI